MAFLRLEPIVLRVLLYTCDDDRRAFLRTNKALLSIVGLRVLDDEAGAIQTYLRHSAALPIAFPYAVSCELSLPPHVAALVCQLGVRLQLNPFSELQGNAHATFASKLLSVSSQTLHVIPAMLGPLADWIRYLSERAPLSDVLALRRDVEGKDFCLVSNPLRHRGIDVPTPRVRLTSRACEEVTSRIEEEEREFTRRTGAGLPSSDRPFRELVSRIDGGAVVNAFDSLRSGTSDVGSPSDDDLLRAFCHVVADVSMAYVIPHHVAPVAETVLHVQRPLHGRTILISRRERPAWCSQVVNTDVIYVEVPPHTSCAVENICEWRTPGHRWTRPRGGHVGEPLQRYCYDASAARVKHFHVGAADDGLVAVKVPHEATRVDMVMLYGLRLVDCTPSCLSADFVFNHLSQLEHIALPRIFKSITIHDLALLEELVFPPNARGDKVSISGCPRLTRVSLPAVDRVDNVGNCTALSTLTFVEGTVEINGVVDCPRLRTVRLPSTLRTLGGDAFRNCTDLAEVDFRHCTKLVALRGFFGCDVARVFMPPHMETRLPRHEFAAGAVLDMSLVQCTEIRNTIGIDLSKTHTLLLPTCPSLTSFVGRAFCSAAALRTLDLRVCSGLTRIDGGFDYCTSLTTVHFNPRLVAIEHSFHRCTALEEVDLRPCVSLERINGFSQCIQLRSVYFPTSVKDIAFNAFRGCLQLSPLLNLMHCTQLQYVAGFADCSSLREVQLPRRAKVVDPAFANCSFATCIGQDASLLPVCSQKLSRGASLAEPQVPETPST